MSHHPSGASASPMILQAELENLSSVSPSPSMNTLFYPESIRNSRLKRATSFSRLRSYLSRKKDDLLRASFNKPLFAPDLDLDSIFADDLDSLPPPTPCVASPTMSCHPMDHSMLYPEDRLNVIHLSIRKEIAHCLSLFSAVRARVGRYSEALFAADVAIQLHATWAPAYLRRADAFSGLEQPSLAIGAVRSAIQLDASYRHDPFVQIRLDRATWCLEDFHQGVRIVQLLVGRDLCAPGTTRSPLRALLHSYARAMCNCIYLIADEETKQCVVVDAAWDTDAVLKHVRDRGWHLVGAIVGHAHVDHIGGMPPPPFDRYRVRVPGLRSLVRGLGPSDARPLPIYMHPLDRPLLRESDHSFAEDSKFDPLRTVVDSVEGTTVRIGEKVVIRFMHTPGHTPGSQIMIVNDCRIISSDTLFSGAVGRCDLPGGCVSTMRTTLKSLRDRLPDDAVLWPGHAYADEVTTIAREKSPGGALDPILWDLSIPKKCDSSEEVCSIPSSIWKSATSPFAAHEAVTPESIGKILDSP
jgi:glyoxylase-like metal-dependent hydrolase (beta-lactamase superfamily II)